jgi:ADP-ribosylglycohydrolase
MSVGPSPEAVLGLEIAQRREEGCDVEGFEGKLAEIAEKEPSQRENLLNGLWSELSSLPIEGDFPYVEPSDLSSILAVRPDGPRNMSVKLSREEYMDRVLGAWLGRCVGCVLGKPVEGWPRARIEDYLGLAGEEGLDDYFPLVEPRPEGFRLHPSYPGAVRESIDGMPRDDDLDYTILGLHVLEEHGLDFTVGDVADEWLNHMPIRLTYTAERATYRNLVNGLRPTEAAAYKNPYREWIGAQIRADIWGYVAPGMPEAAAGLAFRDASLSHVKNGIYGEMFMAAMVSAALVTGDVHEIIEVGVSEIPSESRLAEAVRDVVSWSGDCGDWRDAWDLVMGKYGGYHWVHTINNAAFVLLGLLYGGGELWRTVSISVMAGFDTDCNGATVGSIVGAVLGARALPERWVAPLDDRVRSALSGFAESSISDLAKRTCDVGEKAVERFS